MMSPRAASPESLHERLEALKTTRPGGHSDTLATLRLRPPKPLIQCAMDLLKCRVSVTKSAQTPINSVGHFERHQESLGFPLRFTNLAG